MLPPFLLVIVDILGKDVNIVWLLQCETFLGTRDALDLIKDLLDLLAIFLHFELLSILNIIFQMLVF